MTFKDLFKAATQKTPEYVVCIQHPGIAVPRTTLCGVPAQGSFTFTGIDHAYNNAGNEGRLLICPACSRKAIDMIKQGTYEG